MLIIFHAMVLQEHSQGQPLRFINHVVSLYKLRLLPPLRQAMEGPLSTRWPEIRAALGALVSAVEKAPLHASDIDWLLQARSTFRGFATQNFLVLEGSTTKVAEEQLDPFAHEAAASKLQSRPIESPCKSNLKAAGSAMLRSGEGVVAKRLPELSAPKESPELGEAAN